MNKLYISLITLFLVSGCGGDKAEVALPNTDTTESGVQTPAEQTPEAQTAGAPFISPATLQTETAFADAFVSNNTANISWTGPVVSSTTSIDHIAQSFNAARAEDPTVNEKLRMPQQAIWDNYSTSEKVIYLINSERSARGMRPFRGIAPELVSSSGLYATELSDNEQFSHTYGTYSTTTARLAGWAGVIAPSQTAAPNGSENTTYNTYFIEEMIAFSDTTAGLPIYEAEARAIYYFMYQDSAPTLGGAYIHRNTILTKNPAKAVIPANLMSNNAQPIIGASAVEGMVFGKARNTLVIHGIDPTANWDLSNITTPPGLIGPESATDCLSGSFVESDDGAGNNTSVCQ